MSDWVGRMPRTGKLAWRLCLAGLCLALLAPLAVGDVPPILDYPNHLARLVLLAAGSDDPVLGPIFVSNWAIIPNLAIDAIGPPLLHVLPVHVVGRGLLGITLIANLCGVVALHRALFSCRSFWPLASGLVAYNSTFLLGFMNWQLGSGIAMLAAAGWLVWRDKRPGLTIALAIAASVLLFFCHLMAVAFFVLMVTSAEISRLRSNPAAARRLLALPLIAAAPIGLFLCSDLRNAQAATHWMTVHEKTIQAASPFINYILPLDLISAAVVYSAIAGGLASGWLRMAPAMVPACLVLVVLYVILPFDLMGTSFLDTRCAVMIGYLLFAATDPSSAPASVRRWWAFGCVGLLAVRFAVLTDVWVGHRRDVRDFRATIAAVPPGAKVLVFNVPQTEAPAYWDSGPRSRRLSNTLRAEYHLPGLLLIERGAFWPDLFANPGQQPIRLRPDYLELARMAHAVPPYAMLRSGEDDGTNVIPRFDFVLLLEAGAADDLAGFLPKCAALVVSTDIAALFKVRPGSNTCLAIR